MNEKTNQSFIYLNLLIRSFKLLIAEKKIVLTVICSSAIVAIMQVFEPVLFGRAINSISNQNFRLHYVVIWCVISCGSLLASLVISIFADRLSHRRRTACLAHFLEHFLGLPLSYHRKTSTGETMRIMISGCDSLFFLWLPLMREQMVNIVSLCVIFPIAIYLNSRLASMLLVILTIYFIVNVFVVWQTCSRQDRVEKYFTSITGNINDLFLNTPILQSFLAIPMVIVQIRSALDCLLNVQYPVLNWWAAMTVLTRGTSSISIVVIFAYGATLVTHDLASLGDIVSFVGFATMLITRLDQATMFSIDISTRLPVLKQFFNILDEDAQIEENPNAIPLNVIEGKIVFKQVSFKYHDHLSAIEKVSFEVQPGELVAIVGSTGSGKSTLINLLQRIYDPQSGEIDIDNQNIRNITLSSLRSAISMVFQDTNLFNRTIAENIAIGNAYADQQKIEEAAHLADAHEFIMKKEKGYQTMVGEGGKNLSGGERQRIAIARAFLKNSPILILDEPTAALDIHTEARIQHTLKRLRQGRTTLVITHRLKTIEVADKILFLKNGQMVGQGKFKDLLENNQEFAQLIQHQSKTHD